jgi:hypothetical protein
MMGSVDLQADTIVVFRLPLFLVVAVLFALPASAVAQADGEGAAVDAERGEASVADGPAIRFNKRVHEFGRVLAGNVVRHTFRFTNTGNQPLAITDVKSSCNCATVAAVNKPIPPGGSGEISVSLRTSNSAGKVHKWIVVATNAASPRIQLALNGEVIMPVQVDPPTAYFGSFAGESQQKRTIRIVNNVKQPLKITGVKNSLEDLEVELRAVEEGREYELTVVALPRFQSGDIRGEIYLESNLTEVPTITVPVRGHRLATVSVAPRVLSVPAPRLQSLQRRLLVRQTTGQPLKITNLVVTSDTIDVKAIDAEPIENAYWIILTIPMDQQLPEEGESLTVHTTDVNTPLLTIPIVPQNGLVNQPPDVAGSSSKNSTLLLRFAERLLQRGQEETAKRWLRQIVAHDPMSEAGVEARRLLGETSRIEKK